LLNENTLRIDIDNELRGIFVEISKEAKSQAQWAETESGDTFQSERYCGGFDADEGEFIFSYYAEDGEEYWFHFSLEDVPRVLEYQITGFEAEAADY